MPQTEDILIMYSSRTVEFPRRIDEEANPILKNDGVLSLDEKVAIIGNNAKNSFIGDYIDRTQSRVSFYDGIVNFFRAKGKPSNFSLMMRISHISILT